MIVPRVPLWTVAAPVAAMAILTGAAFGLGGWLTLLIAAGLAASVFAAVYHAEVVAHRVGEPYGTLILAIAVTLIDAVVGVVIAAIILLPERLAALRAARQNRLQKSLNLAPGSALASIGLTIPTVSILSLSIHTRLILGIDAKSMVLLMLSLFIAALVLRTGRTIILHGVVLLVL